jgi:hypothetical protein
MMLASDAQILEFGYLHKCLDVRLCQETRQVETIHNDRQSEQSYVDLINRLEIGTQVERKLIFKYTISNLANDLRI